MLKDSSPPWGITIIVNACETGPADSRNGMASKPILRQFAAVFGVFFSFKLTITLQNSLNPSPSPPSRCLDFLNWWRPALKPFSWDPEAPTPRRYPRSRPLPLPRYRLPRPLLGAQSSRWSFEGSVVAS